MAEQGLSRITPMSFSVGGKLEKNPIAPKHSRNYDLAITTSMKMTRGYLEKIRALITRNQTDSLPITRSEESRGGQ